MIRPPSFFVAGWDLPNTHEGGSRPGFPGEAWPCPASFHLYYLLTVMKGLQLSRYLIPFVWTFGVFGGWRGVSGTTTSSNVS